MTVFDPYVAKTPAKPDRVTLTLTVTQAADGSRAYEGAIAFPIKSNEADPVELERRQADLVPLLNATQAQQLVDLLNAGIDAARSVVP